MTYIREFLKGKKTELQGTAAVIIVALWVFNLMDVTVATQLLALLGFGSAISLGARVNRQK